MDEPTELPEGTEIELVPVDDGFDPEEPGARSIPAADVVTSVFGAVVDATAGVRL